MANRTTTARSALGVAAIAALAGAVAVVSVIASLRASNAQSLVSGVAELRKEIRVLDPGTARDEDLARLRIAAGRLIPEARNAATHRAAEALYAGLTTATESLEELVALRDRVTVMDESMAALVEAAMEAAARLTRISSPSTAAAVRAVEAAYQVQAMLAAQGTAGLEAALDTIDALRSSAAGKDLDIVDDALHAIMRLQEAADGGGDRRSTLVERLAMIEDSLDEPVELVAALEDAASFAARTAVERMRILPPSLAAAAFVGGVLLFLLLLRVARRTGTVQPSRASTDAPAVPDAPPRETNYEAHAQEIEVVSDRVLGWAEMIGVLARDAADTPEAAHEMEKGYDAVHRARMLCLSASIWSSTADDPRVIDATREAARLCEQTLESITVARGAASGRPSSRSGAAASQRLDELATVGMRVSRELAQIAQNLGSSNQGMETDTGTVDLTLSSADDDRRISLHGESVGASAEASADPAPSAPDFDDEDFENL